MELKKKLLGVALSTAIALSIKGCAAEGVPGNGDTLVQANPQVGNQVLCYGVNSCRGQGSCKMVTTTCRAISDGQGMNSCQGKGGVYMTPRECQGKGGTVPQVPL